MIKHKIFVFLLSMLLLLTSCSTYHSYTKPQPGNPAINDINTALARGLAEDAGIDMGGRGDLPKNINDALMPDLTVQSPNSVKLPEERFNISVNAVPANTFFAGLVKGTKYNMVVSPDVKGTITLNLKNVTITDTLKAVHDIYGYQYEIAPYGFHVFPAALETRVFIVNYLDINRTGKSHTTVSSGEVTDKVSNQLRTTGATTAATSQASKITTPTSSIDTDTKSEFWKRLNLTLKSMIGNKEGHQIVVNPEAGIVIVRAYESELDEVAKYLDSMQAAMTRQVILDAKILEVELNDEYQAGIDWSAFGISQTGNQDFTTNDTLKTFNNIFTVDAYGYKFSTLIKLLSVQGNVQVLSSPRISTLNNQKAVIKVGQDEFFITNVSNTVNGIGTDSQNIQDVELTPFFSGISLDVTPEIDANGSVILHIHPIVSQVTDQEKTFTVSGQEQKLPLALSEVRESDNIVRAENGQMVVIAGLMENRTQEHTAQTPFIGKIPVIGSLFRRMHQESTKSELVILLRPIIVGNNEWTTQLRQEAVQYQHLNRGFHVGPNPEIFGTMGEYKQEE